MCFPWVNEKIKKLNCFDYALIKISVFSFTLLLAKFWPDILSLDWRWYAVVFVFTYVYLIIRTFGK